MTTLKGLDDRTRHDVVSRLRCPHGSAVEVQQSGALHCPRGLHQVVDGYYDFLPARLKGPTTAATLESFGYEWTTFDEPSVDDDVFWTRYVRDVDWSTLQDGVAMDAGCGMGRYTRHTARRVKAMIAFDGSEAAAAAAVTLSEEGNTIVLRGLVNEPPVKPRSVDLITCLGVLHHLDDPRSGFDALADRLAPGGQMLVYLYSSAEGGIRGAGLVAARWMRRLTTRLPRPATRILAAPIAVVLYATVVLPGQVAERLNSHLAASLPLQTYRGRRMQSLWLDTFDRLTAPIEHRYRWEEVAPWFDDAGLEVIAVRTDPDLAGLLILARRPVPKPPATSS